MVARDKKNSKKMKNKSWLNIEKIITKLEKTPYYKHTKLFILKKLYSFFIIFLTVELG